ncbi:MAG: 50S ribosomal protein L21 [Thermoleophilaceae bacterium]|nr:50S ribosomal protein L21 [Thermoleophilaceae bacterium]
MYAIVKVGGKQYRVEEGDSLLVDRMPDDEGAKVALEPLLYAGDGKAVFEGADLGKVKVGAVVRGHERGEKIHVLKFKPKRGYKRRTGHRSDLTRLEIDEIKLLTRKPAAETKTAAETKPAAKEPAAKEPAAKKPAAKKSAAKPAAKKPAAKKAGAKKPAAKKPAAKSKPAATKKQEADDGS